MVRKWLFFVLLAMLLQKLAAQERVDTLKVVDVLADSVRREVYEANPVQRLSATDLQRLNSLNVADAARQFAGVQIRDYGGIGGMKTVNVRSLGASQLGLFYNGVQLGNAQNGQVDLGRYSLDNMESISLYNGQQSGIFLPAKAFAMASSLWLTSKRPRFEADRRSSLRTTMRSGSFGLVNPSLLYQQQLGDSSSVSVNAEWLNAHGRYDFIYRYFDYEREERRENTDVQSLRLESSLTGKGKTSEWEFNLYGYQSERGLPGATVSNNVNSLDRQWDKDVFAQFRYVEQLAPKYRVQWNAKYNYNYLRYLSPNYANESGRLQNTYRQHELYLSMVNEIRPMDDWSVSLATDYQYNYLDADLRGFVYPKRHMIMANLASSWQKWRRFGMQANVLATYVAEQVAQGDRPENRLDYSPALSAHYRLTEAMPFYLRAFVKRSFRMPTFNDLYYTLVGSTNLRAEEAMQYNLGLTYEYALNGWFNNIFISGDAYYNRISNRITALPGNNLFRWTMVNLGRVDIKGVDVQMKLRTSLAHDSRLDWGTSYTFQKAIDVDRGSSSYGLYVPYAPRHSGVLFAFLQHKAWGLNYNYAYSDRRYGLLDNSVESNVSAYGIHDLAVDYRFSIGDGKARLAFLTNNVLNENYQVVRNYYMPRRNFRMDLTYQF
ncbi:TonB-dependent receptor plug domain-containing protein [Olivibacter sitiensis]|uniref:TonB-dependent receptor plug domain-containing protein n=1 Tax=Olivibacter sitiensis TaxID=376470 RepID=UPI000485B742|nr:TonB-dependent receptor [Olivibacter sitiensis]